ncbi:MAG: DUF1036 domain-containing protein [Rhodobacteraceae bacterium]|nr:DUF1036 domain-containing protein [Paracoccaceae bacterium]
MKGFGLVVCAGLVSGPAFAGLEICNDTDAAQSVAIGYKAGGDWVSEGWWNIAAGDCTSPIKADLENRYYYFLARKSGWRFADEQIPFCVTSDAFTITGDEDCTNRGFEKALFAKIDSGATARHHTHFLSGYSFPEQPVEDQVPGSFGEPYADQVIFQDCVSGHSDGPGFCSFHGGGTKFFVYEDGRTPDFVFGFLQGLVPGTPIYVEGDLTGIFDSTAEVVLRIAQTRPWTEGDRILDMLQGQWYSVEDSKAGFTVLGAEREMAYDGSLMSLEYLSVQHWCDRFEGDGPYLYTRDEDMMEGQCFAIDQIGAEELTLMYLPRGNFLTYRKLD